MPFVIEQGLSGLDWRRRLEGTMEHLSFVYGFLPTVMSLLKGRIRNREHVDEPLRRQPGGGGACWSRQRYRGHQLRRTLFCWNGRTSLILYHFCNCERAHVFCGTDVDYIQPNLHVSMSFRYSNLVDSRSESRCPEGRLCSESS